MSTPAAVGAASCTPSVRRGPLHADAETDDHAAGEMHIVNARGEDRWIRVARQIVHDAASGAETGVIGMGEDITERKRAAERIAH